MIAILAWNFKRKASYYKKGDKLVRGQSKSQRVQSLRGTKLGSGGLGISHEVGFFLFLHRRRGAHQLEQYLKGWLQQSLLQERLKNIDHDE